MSLTRICGMLGIIALLILGSDVRIALGSNASSPSYQVKAACLRALNESEVGRLTSSEMRLYITICSRLPDVLTSLNPITPTTAVSGDVAYAPPVGASAQEQRSILMGQMNDTRLNLALATLALSEADAKTEAEQKAAQAKADDDAAKESAQECRDLSTTESAFTGGYALNPAAYGRTYLGIAALVAPFFFSHCDKTPTVTIPKPPKDEVTDKLKAQVDSLTLQLQSLTAQYGAIQ
jgi:hypothetical protein